MAAQRIQRSRAEVVTLATTLTRLVPDEDVTVIWVSCDADVRIVYNDSKADGDAIGTNYFRIPANVVFPVQVTGVRLLIAAASATPTVTLLGMRE
jgi:hypothetical protein